MPVCAVEIDSYCRSVLIARQRDGYLPRFPIWDDVRTFDGNPWRGHVDILAGGFPCTDISSAGRGAGITGENSGLWSEMARIIREVRPRFVFVENSPVLTSRGLGSVLGDLAALRYDARWGVFGADDVGAPHIRKRIWIVANADREFGPVQSGRIDGSHRPDPSVAGDDVETRVVADANGKRELQPQGSVRYERGRAGDGGQDMVNAGDSGCYEQRRPLTNGQELAATECSGWWSSEPDVGRMAHGVASRLDRLRAIGNGQVPSVAALAWLHLTGLASRPEIRTR